MINRQALIGLIGANVMKSLSPALHIDAFAAAGITGHDGLLSLEIFNDPFRAGSARGVAIDGHRSLLYLLDQLSARAGNAPSPPPRGRCPGTEFIESTLEEASKPASPHPPAERSPYTMTASYAPRDWAGQPAYLAPDYKSTVLRGPSRPPVRLEQTLSELTGPIPGPETVTGHDADLTRNGRRNGEPLGERIIVAGRVLGDDGVPVPNTMLEIWQANAAGRYLHTADQHDAPIDPNFFGGGRCVTDANGEYRFMTIRPGAYPWPNHHNAWRPNHIHFSLLGPSFLTRLVTQMYFPGDPLLDLDPIFLSTPAGTRNLLVADFTLDLTEPNYALGYRFDIVLRGRHATPMEG